MINLYTASPIVISNGLNIEYAKNPPCQSKGWIFSSLSLAFNHDDALRF